MSKESGKNKKQPWLQKVLGGDLLLSRFVMQNLKLIVLISLYGIVMVSLRYRIESLSREKISVQEHISYLREHRIELQSQYQETIKISAIAAKLDSMGIGLSAGPPYEI